MSKRNSLDSIDEKIIKLQERKKSLQAKQEREIGKYLLKSWNVSSLNEETILKLIDSNKPTDIETLLTYNDNIPDTNKEPSTPNSQA
ncbi:hypothetical protein [Clostridium sp.]|uniref:hypothetical protein n=1 Tax=Clostridium sp. TaxID=1506 RepID=UPI001A3C1595|nr:hypothetical protein [Clostridium sp.]MBK5242795.1 hypothetical protein [Clostridium sp.]